jgi:hypothetical protein
MFKRANKITALLVAAASVMSVVPAMADDSSSASRLGSKDGHITNAVAYQDGKYVYQGYKSDDDTDSIYYNAGDKDKELDDISDSTLNTAYSDKYAFTNDGSDQYLVDLTSGDVTDDTTPSDDVDTAATKLQTKLNKADRYKKDGDVTVDAKANLEVGQDQSNADGTVYAIPGNKFGDEWYSYSVKPYSSDAKSYVSYGDKNLYGFTDGNGKYVDASYTANIYAYSTKEGKTIKIENYSNDYDDADSDSGLLATLVKQPVALTQDKDYVYALVTVAITDTAANSQVTNGVTTTAAGNLQQNVDKAIADKATTTVRTYVQKIAKAQGEQKDDAYLPKTVESYEVGNINGDEFDCGDASDAHDAVAKTLGVSDLTTATQEDAVNVNSDKGISRPKFAVNNGSLIAIEASADKIDAFTLNFKKDKVKFLTYPGYKTADATGTTTEAAAGFDTDNKVDTYFLEKDSDDSFDVNDNNDTDYVNSYDVDVDGNVWGIADGKIYEYKVGGDMTKVYTCDSALDSISVYDENSIFAWEANGDLYNCY